MKMLAFIALHLIAVALGGLAMWWLVFPDKPSVAMADAVIAGVLASYAEIAVTYLQRWE